MPTHPPIPPAPTRPASTAIAPLGVYIHFPYCRKRCPYCDFAIHVRTNIRHADYEAAVLAELDLRAPLFAGRSLVSIYFGGGTPSLWDPTSVARVLSSVAERWGASPSALEVTLEANPDDLPAEVLAALAMAGVNRLSIGAQSFDAARLAELGRLHGAREIHEAAARARAAGFRNLSFDLIYGTNGQRPADLHRDLDQLLSLGAEHLSVYQLTVEPHTPFAAYVTRGTLALPDGEDAAVMSELVESRLAAAGYAHYEVSSYARPGFRAAHNSLYWRGGEWLGLGSSAHSFRRLSGMGVERGERWSTVKNIDAYLHAARRAPPAIGTSAATPLRSALTGGLVAHHEFLDEDTLAREAMWLGLRLLDEGVDRAAFAHRFRADPAVRFAAVLAPLVAGGFVNAGDHAIVLTRAGALLADEVGLRFL